MFNEVLVDSLREQLVTQQNYVLQVSDNYNNPALVIGQLSVNKMAAAHLLHRKRAASLLILSLLLDEEGERPKKRNRKIYMRNWISRREDRGVYCNGVLVALTQANALLECSF